MYLREFNFLQYSHFIIRTFYPGIDLLKLIFVSYRKFVYIVTYVHV